MKGLKWREGEEEKGLYRSCHIPINIKSSHNRVSGGGDGEKGGGGSFPMQFQIINLSSLLPHYHTPVGPSRESDTTPAKKDNFFELNLFCIFS
jgi:hypothetical protein